MSRIQRIILSVSLSLTSLPLFAMGGVGVPFEILRVASADTPGKESLNWRVRGTYFSQEFRPNPGQRFVENRTTVSIGMGYMLANKFGIGVASELVRSVSDTGSTWASKANLEAKVCIVETSPPFSIKIGLVVCSSIPVYATHNGSGPSTLVPGLLVTLDPTGSKSRLPYRLHLNLGYSLTTDGNRLNDLLLIGMGIELTGKEFTPFLELTAEVLTNNQSSNLREDRARLTPGLKWRVSSHINFGLGLDLSISKPPLPGLKLVEDWKVILGVSKF